MTEIDEVLLEPRVVAARAQDGVVLHEHRPRVWSGGGRRAGVHSAIATGMLFAPWLEREVPYIRCLLTS